MDLFGDGFFYLRETNELTVLVPHLVGRAGDVLPRLHVVQDVCDLASQVVVVDAMGEADADISFHLIFDWGLYFFGKEIKNKDYFI